ncbi:MAG: STAS domain-containing protein [Leptolyngbya sp. SIO4C1]|nr:STAS domain-containing protein [Leptolyngbya sp. SIO4C1]
MHSFESSVRVIRPLGAITAASADKFTQELVSAISSETAAELMVDMSEVDTLDSAGLVSLMSALKTAQSLSKQLSLCSVPPSIRIVFELTQLDRVFTFTEPLSVVEPVAA